MSFDLHGIYAEWEREERARREQSDRLKDLFKNAKIEGFNPKGLRVAFAEKFALDHLPAEKVAKRSEDANDADLYLAALSGPRTPAYARGSESTTQNTSFSGHDSAKSSAAVTTPETEPQSAPSAASDLTTSPSLNGQVAPIQSFADVAAHDAEANQDQSNAVAPVPATQDGSANAGGGNEVASPTNDHEMEKGREPADARHGADRVALGSDVEAVAPLTFAEKIKKLRPMCQRPERCASSGGKDHCYTCKKAAAETGGVLA